MAPAYVSGVSPAANTTAWPSHGVTPDTYPADSTRASQEAHSRRNCAGSSVATPYTASPSTAAYSWVVTTR